MLAGVLVWLPLVRGATQGDAYQWALAPGIGGRGIGGDYWMLLIAAAFIGALLYLGWRGARPPFHWLLLFFHLPLTAAVFYAALRSPHSLRFAGATIGADFSLAVAGPLLFGGFALLATVWVVRDRRTRRAVRTAPWVWTRSARVRAALVIALFGVEAALFPSRGIQSTANFVGVGLVFWQWVMINRALAASRDTPSG